jgi:hypothetical protein
MPWWDDGLVGCWILNPPMNTELARCLGGKMAWFVGGFVALGLILCLQDALVG